MFSCHIILLLLAWRCSEVSGNSEPIAEDLDQIATASIVRIQNTTGNHSILERPFRNVEITTIRYENSNGFVPKTQESQTVSGEEKNTFGEKYSVDRNFTSEEHLSLFIKNPEYSEDGELLENDPFYSTEARIFLSLTQPILNRRSSDIQGSTNDFELLRINNDTPIVANYQNFYNSLTGANQRARDKVKEDEEQNSRTEFYQERRNMEREKNSFDDRPRNNKMENYLMNYEENLTSENPRNVATGSQYFSYSQIHDDQNINGYKELGSVRNDFPPGENFDYSSHKKGKILQNFRTTPQQNHNQHDLANYQFNIPNSQQVEPFADLNYHNQRRPKQKSSHNSHRPRINVKQHVLPNTESISNVKSNMDNISPRSQNYNPITRSEESPSYFEHEALFNREEMDHAYEKNEEAREMSDENYEYVEVTEKPKRFRKQKKRPTNSDDSKRLPKEHRDFDDSIDIEETTKPRPRHRPKIRNHKTKGDRWPEYEEDSDEGGFETAVESTVNSEIRKPKFYRQNYNHKSKGNSWANVSPNLEISHSTGIEIDQVGKPKLVLPVKVNLVPLSNFDHATALGNSQGFDLSNAVLQNFVTATPIAFTSGSPISPITSILNTPNSIFNQNTVKNLQNLQNQNIKLQTPVTDVIVGQNPIQTIIVPQQNYQTPQKIAQNLKNVFLQSNHNSYAQNQIPNPNPQATNFNIPQQHSMPQNTNGNLPIQNPVYNPNQNQVRNFQSQNLNQVQHVQGNTQFNNPHPTSQTFENIPQNIGQPTSNYVQVNTHGLQGQNSPSTQNVFSPQNNVVYSTMSTHNGNMETAESQSKRNMVPGTNGQFLASASFTVGEQIQNQINAQNMRPQILDNLNQPFHHDHLTPKIKGFVQNTYAVPSFMNLHNQNGLSTQMSNRDHQAEQITQASNVVAQTYKDQNQQILKVANEIFESTLKQLKQLQRSQSFRPNRLGNQNSQSLDNGNLPIVGTKNVEIINPTIRPSPIDLVSNNPSENSNNFGGIGFTTAFPIFPTNGFYTSPKTPILSTIGPLSIHGYVNSLTEIGTKENDLKTSPTTNLKPSTQAQRLEPVLFNPINFVPNVETLQNQKALNSKYNIQEPLLQGLNLVPIIPGGNFYKNSHNAQDDLASKPKLSSDLQKYAEEMFKESLKTIYNTQKWNNDHKAQASEISTVTSSPKVKDDLHNIKFLMPDVKPSKQILEAHFTEHDLKNAGSQSPVHSLKSTDELKKLPDFSDISKPDFKLPPPITLEPVRFYYKPNIHLSRPTISDTSLHPDIKFNPDLTGMDYIQDFLIPPKPNAFVSKSPFNEPMPKRRPGHKRPNSDIGTVKFHSRPDIGSPRPPTGVVESSASNAHHSFSFDAPRFEFLQGKPPFDHENQDFDADFMNSYSGIRGQSFHSKYPSLTTSSPFQDDFPKPSSTHNYDYNHPRMHNLMGLLRKNKRLPPGNSQSFMVKKKGVEEPFENDKRQNQTQSFVENSRSFIEEISDRENLETNVNPADTEKSHA